MAYQLPKREGGAITGLTIKDGKLIGPNGDVLGPVNHFPDLQDSEGNTVEMPADEYKTVPLTNDAGEVMPETPAPVSLADDKGDTERTGPTGIKQKGMTLGGIKNFLQGTGLELADGQGFFGEIGGPAAGGGGPNSSDMQVMGASKGEADKRSKGGMWETVIDSKGIGKTTPYATGQSNSEQEGTAQVGDRADLDRAIGADGKKDPTNWLDYDFMSKNPRAAAKSAFLDPNNKGYDAIRARNAAVGVVNMHDAGGALKMGDKYYTSKSGKSGRDFAFELTGGQSGFNAMKDDLVEVGKDGIIDTPVTTGESDDVAPEVQKIQPTEQNMKDAGKAFAADYLDRLKNKNKQGHYLQ